MNVYDITILVITIFFKRNEYISLIKLYYEIQDRK